MKVIRKGNKTIQLQHLKKGEVCKIENDYYIKTDTYIIETIDGGTDEFNLVNLKTGQLKYYNIFAEVEIINSELYIYE